MKRIRLVAVDLDGTLLDDRKQLPAENREVLQEIERRGLLISIASGRMISTIESIESQLGVDSIIIAYNGAKVLGQSREGRPLLVHRPIPAAVAEFFIRFSREHGYLLNLYHEDRLYAEDGPLRRPFMEIYSTRTGAEYNVVANLEKEFAGVSPTKLILLTHESERDRLHDELGAKLSGQASITKSEPEYLEIMAAGVDKGSALPLIAEHYGIPTDEMMAVGDAENDIGMLRAAGLGVALANSSPDVRAAADVVTERTNNQGGAAEAIRRWALPTAE
ncbi:MAG: HAD family phosphatase [Acidobacteria bacterium]|nr:HAD family phosphatase [Acidobacteriota bacterium]